MADPMTVTDALESAGISPRVGCEAEAVAELARQHAEYRDLLRLARGDAVHLSAEGNLALAQHLAPMVRGILEE